MKQIFKRFRVRDYFIVIMIFSFILTQTYFEMELISKVSELITAIQAQQESSVLWQIGFRMIGIAFLIFSAILVVNILATYLSNKIARDLRRDVFIKVNSFSASEINKFSTPSLITRTTNDISQIQRTLMTCMKMLFTAPCMAFFAIRKITLTNMALTGVSITYLIVMLVMLITLIVVVLPKFGKLQKQTDRLNLVTRENLTGIKVVRAYNAENYQENKFDNANNELTRTQLFLNRTMSLMDPGLHMIMNLMTLTIYWVGAYLIRDSLTNYATIATFGQYSMHVIMSFMFITLMFVMIPRGIVSIRRVNEILNTTVSIQDGGVGNSEAKGTIEFRNVSFSYPDAEESVLENITFKAEKGETVAFIGSTGSGKSTLINLVPRFYDVTSGEVLVDGINVKAYNLEHLHDKIEIILM